MEIPRELIKAAEERGIDITDLIINAISKNDPSIGVKLRLQLAEKYLNEAKDYVSKGDAVQASEKLYKAAEECVKALAEKFDTPEHQQAIKEGRWYTYQLGSVAGRLAEQLGDWVLNGWSSAYFLHVWGFHEARLNTDDLIRYMRPIENLITNTRRVVES